MDFSGHHSSFLMGNMFIYVFLKLALFEVIQMIHPFHEQCYGGSGIFAA